MPGLPGKGEVQSDFFGGMRLPLNSDKKCSREVTDESAKRLFLLIGDKKRARERVERLRSAVSALDEQTIRGEAEVFRAMADPCRLAILKLLLEGELCVCEIMAALNRPQSSTSHHLSVLKEAGLIKERKDGKWSLYRLSEGAVIEMMNLAELLQ